MCDCIFYRGISWISTDEAAALLGILPSSLVRNHDTVSDLALIDFVVWHGVWFWREGDVLEASRLRLAHGRHAKNVGISTVSSCISPACVL